MLHTLSLFHSAHPHISRDWRGCVGGEAGSARTSSHPAQRGPPWSAPASRGWRRWLRGLCWCRRGSCQRSQGSRQRAGVLPRCLSAKEVEWAWSTTNGWKLPTLSEMGRARRRGTMADRKCTCRSSQGQMTVSTVFILNPSTLPPPTQQSYTRVQHTQIQKQKWLAIPGEPCFQGRVVSDTQQQPSPLSLPSSANPPTPGQSWSCTHWLHCRCKCDMTTFCFVIILSSIPPFTRIQR